MTTQSEIFKAMQTLIPAGLWEKYSHLSFAEMAEVEELSEWADELRKAESNWYDAEDA